MLDSKKPLTTVFRLVPQEPVFNLAATAFYYSFVHGKLSRIPHQALPNKS